MILHPFPATPKPLSNISLYIYMYKTIHIELLIRIEVVLHQLIVCKNLLKAYWLFHHTILQAMVQISRPRNPSSSKRISSLLVQIFLTVLLSIGSFYVGTLSSNSNHPDVQCPPNYEISNEQKLENEQRINRMVQQRLEEIGMYVYLFTKTFFRFHGCTILWAYREQYNDLYVWYAYTHILLCLRLFGWWLLVGWWVAWRVGWTSIYIHTYIYISLYFTPIIFIFSSMTEFVASRTGENPIKKWQTRVR